MTTTTRNLLTLDDGTRIPRLGFGTWQLKGETAYRATRAALELGYRHVDTAQIYGNEEEVGRAIADSGIARDELFVTTKVWRDKAAPEDVASSTRESLRKLGLDHVDLLLLHWPSEEHAPTAETVGAMAREREAGNTRHIGVSNFPPALLREAIAAGPVVNDQVEFNVNLGAQELVDIALEHGGFVTAYAPLVSGEDVAGRDVLEEIAGNHGATWHQVALAWLLAQDGVATLPRSSNRDHIAANLEALGIDLADDELAALDALPKDRRNFTPDFGPDWD